MLQKEIDELKEQLGMAYPGQEGYSDRGRGELGVWVQVFRVGVGQVLMGEVT